MRVLLMTLAGLGLVAVCRASVQPEPERMHGETHDQQQEVDDGVCVPLKCEHGSPPPQCTRLCALRKWVPTCAAEGGDCVCRGPDGQQASPDEMKRQDEATVDAPYTYTILTIFFPDSFWTDADPDVQPTEESELFQTVNVHEGRLLWDFRYVLGGLLALMVGLVAYELVLCRKQNAKAKLQMDPFDLYGVEKPNNKKEVPMVI